MLGPQHAETVGMLSIRQQQPEPLLSTPRLQIRGLRHNFDLPDQILEMEIREKEKNNSKFEFASHNDVL